MKPAVITPIPYFRQAPSTAHIMRTVILALIPGVIVLTAAQGTRWLAMLALACMAAWLFEGLFLGLRGRSAKIVPTLADGSATLTALLLMISLPVSVPPWLAMLGVGFALVVGKQLYGGLGMNTFNPAMAGFAFLLISFPAQMGQHFAESLSFFSVFAQQPDAVTAATLLDHSRQLRIAETPVAQAAAGLAGAAFWQTLLLHAAWCAGGLYLAVKRYLDWRIPLFMLTAAFLTALVFWLINPEAYLSPAVQLMAGTLFFGAWFIATDPVTAAASKPGRILYAVMIGVLTICIRNLGRFPDGLAFAVLLANACVPVIDSLTRPRYR